MFLSRAQRIVVTGITLVSALMVAVGGIGVWRMHLVEERLTDDLAAHYHRGRLADQMQHASLQRLLVLQAMVAASDPFVRNDLMDQLQVHGQRYMAAREQLEAGALEPGDRQLLAKQAAAANQAAPLVQQVAELLVDGRDREATTLLVTQVIPAQGALVGALQQIIAEQGRRIDRDTRAAQRDNHRAIAEVAALAGIGVVLSVFIGWLTHRQLDRILSMLHGLLGRLRRAGRRERAIRTTMLDGLITADRRGQILTANPAAERLLGYARGELAGQNLSQLMPAAHARQHDGYVNHYLASGETRIIGTGREVDARRKDGQLVPVELGVVHLRQDGEHLFVGFLHDIRHRKENERLLGEAKANLETEVLLRTAELQSANQRLAREVAERKQAQEQLARQATHDALTGLPNRRLFDERLSQAATAARRHDQGLAVMYLDLDGFKQVNDSLGHHAGDELLCRTAERLRQVLRHEDVIARLGGDEFAVLLERLTDQEALTRIGRKLVDTLGQPVAVAGTEVTVGASVGIARLGAATDAEALLRRADQAMYEAKRAGRGQIRFFCDTAMAQSAG